jgi:hypothetical protein
MTLRWDLLLSKTYLLFNPLLAGLGVGQLYGGSLT